MSTSRVARLPPINLTANPPIRPYGIPARSSKPVIKNAADDKFARGTRGIFLALRRSRTPKDYTEKPCYMLLE